MNEKHYKLRFLPLFEEDLNEIVDYITHRLKNPIAADALVSDVQTAIRNRLSCAEGKQEDLRQLLQPGIRRLCVRGCNGEHF